jgi:hypothetical protein
MTDARDRHANSYTEELQLCFVRIVKLVGGAGEEGGRNRGRSERDEEQRLGRL